MRALLFVCTGNICRSPTAEGVFRHKARAAGVEDRLRIESAGMGGWHIGEEPDPRAMAAAVARGFSLDGQRARQIDPGDFHEFDLILGMDRGHMRQLERVRPSGARAELRLFLDFAPGHEGRDVPDPYYGDAGGFEEVLDMVEAGAEGLLRHILEAGRR